MIPQRKRHFDIRKASSNIGAAGVGFVVIPDVETRAQYIEDCYRTNTVTIQGGQGYGFFPDVHVDSDVMQQLSFPSGQEGDNRGSAVVWVRDDVTGLPVIVAVLRKQDDYYALAENQRRWACSTPNGSVEVFADGNGNMNVSITGSDNFPAALNVKVSSDNADSVLNLSSDSEVRVQADKKIRIISAEEIEFGMITEGEQKTTLTYKAGEGLIYKDEFDNEITVKDGEINIVSKKISHNDGKEPMVLGDSLADFIGEFIDACMKLTVVTPAGTSSIPVNVADFAKLKTKFDSFKSKKSNLE